MKILYVIHLLCMGAVLHSIYLDIKRDSFPTVIDHNVVVVSIDSITKIPIDTTTFVLKDTIR